MGTEATDVAIRRSVTAPLVGVIMGSDSDLRVMQDAVDVLARVRRARTRCAIVSAHRTPDVMSEYARTRRRPRAARDHRRRRRCRAPARHDRVDDDAAGHRRPRAARAPRRASTRCCRSSRCPPGSRWRPSPSATHATPGCSRCGSSRRRGSGPAGGARALRRGARRDGAGQGRQAARRVTAGRGPVCTTSLRRDVARPARRRAPRQAGVRSWPAPATVVTYRELDDRSNQLAQLLHDRGLGFGDHIAIFMDNDPRYLEVVWAAQRSGSLLHADQLPLQRRRGRVHPRRLRRAGVSSRRPRSPSVGLASSLARLPERPSRRASWSAGTLDGYEPYDDAVAGVSGRAARGGARGPRDDVLVGHDGPPEGHQVPARAASRSGRPTRRSPASGRRTASTTSSVYLSPAPLYHAAPLQFCIAVHRFGGTAVILEHFDPEACLAAIEQYRVTHAQFVPTMFVRMLKLPEEVREQVRRVVAADRDPRRRAVPGRDQAADDRVVGPDHLRVLRRRPRAWARR